MSIEVDSSSVVGRGGKVPGLSGCSAGNTLPKPVDLDLLPDVGTFSGAHDNRMRT